MLQARRNPQECPHRFHPQPCRAQPTRNEGVQRRQSRLVFLERLFALITVHNSLPLPVLRQMQVATRNILAMSDDMPAP